MKLELDVFVKTLATAEEQATFTPPEVSDYVLKNIYEPMLRDEDVLFADLDFDAFSDEDLDDLENMIEQCDSVERKLKSLNSVFCKSMPVTRLEKAFC